MHLKVIQPFRLPPKKHRGNHPLQPSTFPKNIKNKVTNSAHRELPRNHQKHNNSKNVCNKINKDFGVSERHEGPDAPGSI